MKTKRLIPLHLTHEEYDKYTRLAEESELKPAEWIRQIVASVVRGELVRPDHVLPSLHAAPDGEITPIKSASTDMTISDDAALDLLTAGYLEQEFTFNAPALESAWKKLRDHLMGTELEDRNKYIGVTGGVLDGRVINRS